MKEPALQEWACRLLEDQLERLGELRNANPRDAAFKLWRQTTLTVIQRVWPGNLQRSEKFRRIPFTAPSAKPNRAQVKEHYERGCTEANSYLRGLIQEIQYGALDGGEGIETRAQAPASDSAERASIAESLSAPLPGEVSSAPRPPVSSAPVPPPKMPPPTPPPSRQEAAASAKPTRKTERALKDMLGFTDATSPDSEAPPGPAPTRSPLAESHTPARPGPAFGDPFRREREPEPPSAPHARDSQTDTSDLLSSSPVFQASPRPVTSPAPPAATRPAPTIAPPSPVTTQANPVAAALGALASEVSALGVPEGQRAAARAALTDLARRIDDRTATWETLRDAFHLVLEYPRLARRAIPLLVGFLELE